MLLNVIDINITKQHNIEPFFAQPLGRHYMNDLEEVLDNITADLTLAESIRQNARLIVSAEKYNIRDDNGQSIAAQARQDYAQMTTNLLQYRDLHASEEMESHTPEKIILLSQLRESINNLEQLLTQIGASLKPLKREGDSTWFIDKGKVKGVVSHVGGYEPEVDPETSEAKIRGRV